MAEIGEILGAAGNVITTVNPLAGAAVSLVAGLINGGTPSVQTVTAQQAGLLSGGFAGPVLATGTAVGPPVGGSPAFGGGTGGGVVQTIARAAAPIVQQLAGGGATVAAAAGGVRTVTRRQLILMQARAFSPGATAKKIVKAARDCGIEIAAATFGLAIIDVCFLIAQPPSRRSRGISAADMRRTRSTIRKVTTIQKQLKALSGPIRRK